MRLSKFLLKTTKPGMNSAGASPSQDLLNRAGMVRQVSSGLFAWMPLGVRTMNKIEKIIREEMAAAGAMEVSMPIFQPADIWYESGRLKKDDSAYGQEMLRVRDRRNQELVVSPTCEELAATIMGELSLSAKDLPANIYQIQTKFRDEMRPRNGVIRAREFVMKDGYSFDESPAEAEATYHKMFAAYQRIFHRIGVPALPLPAERGPVGGSMSHEFVILADTGDSLVAYDERLMDTANVPDRGIYGDPARLAEHFARVTAIPGQAIEDASQMTAFPPGSTITEGRAIEVGHIFNLGTKYSEPAKAGFNNAANKKELLQMGCYGIGVSRLPAAIIEASHDDKGIIWPHDVAPFESVIVNLHPQDPAATALADRIYTAFQAAGFDVLYDDRDMRAGPKLADMDLIGIPTQIRIGKNGAAQDQVEMYDRQTGEITRTQPDILCRVGAP